MSQENKLLLQDLSARLPYGVKVYAGEDLAMTLRQIDYEGFCEAWENKDFQCHSRWMCPYLRPMSSMTEEEFENLKEYSGLKYEQLDLASYQNGTYKCLDFYLSEVPSDVVILVFDWLNAHHFDYRGLIEKGLALKAPDGMYEINKK